MKAGGGRGWGQHKEPQQSGEHRPPDEVSPGHVFPAQEPWEQVALPLCNCLGGRRQILHNKLSFWAGRVLVQNEEPPRKGQDCL